MHASVCAHDLKKTYPSGTHALAGISLEVFPGEILGLLGPNGAGKTTVLRILATLSQPTAGRAAICGFDVRTQAKDVRRRIGYVAQTIALDLLATGRENLLLHASLFGIGAAQARARTQELIESFGLADIANRPVRTYSGGMRRRLDLAAGLIHVPSVLFLDEPTNGLDPTNRHLLWDHIRALASQHGMTVLLTTHYMDEADALAHRIAIIDAGRIVVTGTPTALKRSLSGDVVTVELEGPGRIKQAEAILQSLDGVTRVIGDTTAVFAQVRDGAVAVPRIVEALRSEGIILSQIAISRPTLDQVYLSTTGRKYEVGPVRSRMGPS